MARPLRLEFPGALYHITSRGDAREDIYLGDADRRMFLALLAEVCERFHWWGHAYCLMSNHYHLLMKTPDANLAKGMRQLNGVYTRRFNRSHGRCEHVFQGRRQAIIVQKETHLKELARDIVLNPVRAWLLDRPQVGHGAATRRRRVMQPVRIGCIGTGCYRLSAQPKRLAWSTIGASSPKASGSPALGSS